METIELIIQLSKLVGGAIAIYLLYQIKKSINNTQMKGGQN